MTETDFQTRADDVLFAIGDALDASTLDCDWEVSEGILTIDLEGGKIVVNRHTPNREIWLAASSMGAAHFAFDGAAWRDTRGGPSLGAAIRKVVATQSGEVIALSLT